MDEKIHPSLEALAVPIRGLVPDPMNARAHDRRNIEAIKASLTEFGQRKPIVVQTEGSVVRAGNATLQAAKELEWERIAAVFVDESQTKARKFALADNRTAELARWDDEMLSQLMDEESESEGWDLSAYWMDGELEARLGGDSAVDGGVDGSHGGHDMNEWMVTLTFTSEEHCRAAITRLFSKTIAEKRMGGAATRRFLFDGDEWISG